MGATIFTDQGTEAKKLKQLSIISQLGDGKGEI